MDDLRYRFLTGWSRAVTGRPVLTLIICSLIAVAAAIAAALLLKFQTHRSDLIAPDLPWNARYAAYKENFPRADDFIVVIDGPRGSAEVDAAAAEFASRAEALPQITSADAGFHPLEHPRMFRTAPPDAFDQALAGLRALKAVATSSNANGALLSLLRASTGDLDIGELEAMLDPFIDVAAGGEPRDFSIPGFEADWFQPFTTATGRLRLVFVSGSEVGTSASGFEETLQQTRDVLRETLEARSDMRGGVTGIPAIEADETAQSIDDSTRASILALALITVLVVVIFRGVVVPIIAVLSLFIGLGWSFGWVVLSVGHLQLLSVVFSVVLMGLGIDFAVHMAARLESVHERFATFGDALEHTFRSVGPGLITGAVTTASAFAVIAFTDFKGAAELGIISAGGIILCLIAVMCTFPALLVLVGDWRRSIRTWTPRSNSGAGRWYKRIVLGRPWATIVVAVIAIAALGWAALRIEYDPNVLNLQPPGVESVMWEKRLIDEDERSVWAALSLVDPEAAGDRTDAFRALPEVSQVGAMGALFPADRAGRIERIAEVGETAAAPAALGEGGDILLSLLQQVLAGAGARVSADDAPAVATIERLQQKLGGAMQIEPAARESAWRHLNESFLAKRDVYRAFVEEALASGWIGPADLPPALRQQWVGRDGSWLLQVYPVAAGDSVLDPARLGPFVSAVRSVDPLAIGPPVQIYESSIIIQRAYRFAAICALPVILVILVIDFRSLSDSLLAVLPVVCGFVAVFGMMQLTGTPLNFANMIVMPIILGIGVDAGVHVVHRWRADPDGSPPGLSGGTGRAITVTMLTTMIGFGSMMIAEHRGIRSLGFVMVVGLAGTLIASGTFLPAILRLRHPARLEREAA